MIIIEFRSYKQELPMKTKVFMGGSCLYHTLHAQCIHDDRYDGCK